MWSQARQGCDPVDLSPAHERRLELKTQPGDRVTSVGRERGDSWFEPFMSRRLLNKPGPAQISSPLEPCPVP